jgi:hypothetical protein
MYAGKTNAVPFPLHSRRASEILASYLFSHG